MLLFASLLLTAGASVELAESAMAVPGLQAQVVAAWRRMEALTGITADAALTVELRPLPPGIAAASSFRRIVLRQGQPQGAAFSAAVAHEVGHQFLLAVCPQAGGDRLFHEAFAIATSGELDAWLNDGYLSADKARALLSKKGVNLDAPDARRAIARLLSNTHQPHALPAALAARMLSCQTKAAWGPPLHVDALAMSRAAVYEDAFVALSRHSGEVLERSGAAARPMPFGSTLKPLVAALDYSGAPVLRVDPRDPLWRCGDALPEAMGLDVALARSCNAYFLAWQQQAGLTARLRTDAGLGAVMLALGLQRLPQTMDELIGLRPTLALDAIALAHLYRVLALLEPRLLVALRATTRDGTLAGVKGLGPLAAMAVKTGTVRDPESAVELGWIVAVSDDVVYVMARRGYPPRAFAAELAERIARGLGAATAGLLGEAQVQSFGLLSEARVQVRCARAGVLLRGNGIELLRPEALHLGALDGKLLCLHSPLLVELPAAPNAPPPLRRYAGWIERRPLPKASAPSSPSPLVTPREAKARAGSEFVFHTTEARYVAGVLNAEDAAISGAARDALASAILHNQRQGGRVRHGGRPVCDTTHCQVFLGTLDAQPVLPGVAALAAELQALLRGQPWAPFAQGGAAPWTEARALARVSEVLGVKPVALSFDGRSVSASVPELHGDVVSEALVTLPCERLRGPLKLPSCPRSALIRGDEVVLSGVGQGHGEGLDVEWSKQSGLGAREILRMAYPTSSP